MHDRSRHLDEVTQIVSAWTSQLTKAEAAAQAKQFRIPCSPVRDVSEVMHDPHMHGRGMLEWVDHPDLGRVVLPASPIRLHGTGIPPARPARAWVSTTLRCMAAGWAWGRTKSRH